MRSRKIEAYKLTLSLTAAQREMLVGLLLGDACLETQNGGRTFRMRVEYSLKNRSYAEHVYEQFREWVLSPPRVREVRSRGHRSQNVAFSTLSHGALRFYAQQFYSDRRKRVPPLIEKLLTPRGLAYWFMDDGSMKSTQSKAVILNTQGYERKEVGTLVALLQGRFGLEATERTQREGYQVYVSGRSYERFVALVETWIHPSMRYKIPEVRRTQLPKL